MKKIISILIFINLLFCVNLFAAKNLYLSYKSVPKNVYKNQRFEIVVKALVTTEYFDQIKTSFSGGNIQPLNKQSSWKKISDNVYENSFYYKASSPKFQIPNLNVSLEKNAQVIDKSILNAININYSDIAKGDIRFSGVIAKDLKLKAYKTKQYNNKESLTIIDIDAIGSNLENFKLNGISEQGVTKLNDNYSTQNIIYYFVMPVHKKKVVFNYYNTSTKSLQSVTIPLILQNELVSTQTDLNPNDSSFEKYKKIAVAIFFIIFLIIYILKRNKIYLVITIILFIITSIYLMPNQKGIVKKDSFIYILPTKNSTIFFKLDEKQKVEVLSKKRDFIKIMGIDNKFIGWVKEENFEED